MTVNDRELAVLVWIGIALLLCLLKRDLRRALANMASAVLKPVIVVPLALFAAYLVGLIWVASKADLWQPQLINDAMVWFFVGGLALLFNIERVFAQDDFFRRTTKTTLKAAIVVEVFVNLVVMPFAAEFLLVPIVTFLTMLSAFSEGNEEYAPAKKLVDGILAAVGFGILAFVVLSLILNPDLVSPAYGARELALPVWLALGSLPFIYLFGLYAAYDHLFTRLLILADDSKVPGRLKLALALKLHVRARMVGTFRSYWQRRLLQAPDSAGARRVVGEFLREQREIGVQAARG